MIAVRSAVPETGGYILSLTDGNEIRVRTGQDPRNDLLVRALANYLETHPGEPVEIGGPDAS